MANVKTLDATCTKCGRKIAFGTTHVKVSLLMMNRKTSVQRLCPECCRDASTTVIIGDVCDYPVAKILIEKVWA